MTIEYPDLCYSKLIYNEMACIGQESLGDML